MNLGNSDILRGDENSKFQSGIGPTTDKIINYIIEIITADSFREKITNKLVDPVTEMINAKVKPYIYMSIGLYCLVIVLLLIIIYLLISTRNRCRL